MAIPDFQTAMRPLLELHADGQPKTQEELRGRLADHFRLSADELAERLPSGRTTRFASRVAWASSHMKAAGLLVKPRRGISQITQRGLAILGEHPERVDMSVLQQFPEYVEFRRSASGRSDASEDGREPRALASDATPDEAIEASYAQARAALGDELLSRLIERDDGFFERVVLDVLVALGYGGPRPDAAERVGRSGDGGIDGVIREDRLGLDAIYVQAKKWAPGRTVGPGEIREFIGALQDVEATKGVFITTSAFSKQARELAQRRRVVLLDGLDLAELMVDSGVGVSTIQTYELKRIDEDYFTDAD